MLFKNVLGDVVEFGCYVGTTSVYLQKTDVYSERVLHVYDSVEDLPDKTQEDRSPVGEQFVIGALSVSKNLLIKNFKHAGLSVPIVHKAWFYQLTQNDLPDSIAFAYLDGDYYRSILTCLKLIWPKLSFGLITIK